MADNATLNAPTEPDTHRYTKCTECHLFVEPNHPVDVAAGCTPFLHLHRGDDADEALDESHEARPSDDTHPVSYWKVHGPEAMRLRFTS